MRGPFRLAHGYTPLRFVLGKTYRRDNVVAGKTKKFNLMRVEFKRIDGTDDIISVPFSMAALVVSEDSHPFDTVMKRNLFNAYYALKLSGKMNEIKPPLKGKDDEARMIDLFSRYTMRDVYLYDDGTPVEDEDEAEEDEDENPTNAS